jgi:hypothetical protein
MAIELIHGKDVERLKDEELRSVLNALLDADASQHRVPLVDLSVTTRNDDPDAGIDAWPAPPFTCLTAHSFMAANNHLGTCFI